MTRRYDQPADTLAARLHFARTMAETDAEGERRAQLWTAAVARRIGAGR